MSVLRGQARIFRSGALGVAILLSPRASFAAPLSTPVAVVGIETEDAERLAEGLTEAIERSVDKTPGWRKVHVRESLSTLGFAFKCPTRPDAACLERIAQHLGVELIMWGTMRRSAEARFDVAMHLWRRRGPGADHSVRLVASKDPSNDPLVESVGSACAKTLLSPIRSTLVVKVTSPGASIVRVDGSLRGEVVGGVARVSIEPGPRHVEVSSGGEVIAARDVEVRGDEEVELVLGAGPRSPADGSAASGFPEIDIPWKSVAGYGSLAAGGAFGVAAIVEAVRYSDAKSELEQTLKLIPSTVPDVCATDLVPNAVRACRYREDAATARTLGFVFGALSVVAIGGGAALLWSAANDQATQPRLGFVPRPGGGHLTFTAPLD